MKLKRLIQLYHIFAAVPIGKMVSEKNWMSEMEEVIMRLNWAKYLPFAVCTAMLAGSVCVANAEGFDAEYYAAQNPDVVAVIGTDAAALELHYNTFGRLEGRGANAQDVLAAAVSLEDFDAEWYAAQNPDVAAIFGTDVMSLYTHYITCGIAEGRAPSASAAAASKSGGSGSSEENPYARFASSGSGSSHRSSSSSSSSSSSHYSSSNSSSSFSESSASASASESETEESDITELTCTYDEDSCILTIKLGQALPDGCNSYVCVGVNGVWVGDQRCFEDEDDRQTITFDLSYYIINEDAAELLGISDGLTITVEGGLYLGANDGDYSVTELQSVTMTVVEASTAEDSSDETGDETGDETDDETGEKTRQQTQEHNRQKTRKKKRKKN